MASEPTYTVALASGYWHVRFGPQRFIQWPCGGEPTANDSFGFDGDNVEPALDAARRAVAGEERG